MKLKSIIIQVIIGIAIILITIGLNSQDLISYSWDSVKSQIINIEKIQYANNTSTGTTLKQYSKVDLEYKYNNNNYSYSGLIVYDSTINIDQELQISVNPLNPEEIYFREINWLILIIFTFFGLLVLVTGLIELLKVLKKRFFST